VKKRPQTAGRAFRRRPAFAPAWEATAGYIGKGNRYEGSGSGSACSDGHSRGGGFGDWSFIGRRADQPAAKWAGRRERSQPHPRRRQPAAGSSWLEGAGVAKPRFAGRRRPLERLRDLQVAVRRASPFPLWRGRRRPFGCTEHAQRRHRHRASKQQRGRGALRPELIGEQGPRRCEERCWRHPRGRSDDRAGGRQPYRGRRGQFRGRSLVALHRVPPLAGAGARPADRSDGVGRALGAARPGSARSAQVERLASRRAAA
jgi:hypothetical protein